MFAYLIVLQIIGLVLAFQTRKVKLHGLRDSKFVAAIIYISSIILVALALVTFSLRTYINIGTAIITFGVFSLTTIFLALMFIPKVSQQIGIIIIIIIKSGLGRVRNCVSKLALCIEMVASFYMSQPNHSYADFMFSLHSDPTRAIVVAGVLHRVWSELPHQGSYLFIGLWPHSFHKIMYLYSICLVSTTCCDATITKHKHNTNIQ